MIKGLIIQKLVLVADSDVTSRRLRFSTLPSVLKVKYKQEVGGSLYQQLPETAETQLAKELRGVYSQVRRSPPLQPTWPRAGHVTMSSSLQVKYGEDGKKEMERSLYSLLPETAETQFARHVSEIQSEVRTLNASHRRSPQSNSQSGFTLLSCFSYTK